jgi:hypothetical protein
MCSRNQLALSRTVINDLKVPHRKAGMLADRIKSHLLRFREIAASVSEMAEYNFRKLGVFFEHFYTNNFPKCFWNKQ